MQPSLLLFAPALLSAASPEVALLTPTVAQGGLIVIIAKEPADASAPRHARLGEIRIPFVSHPRDPQRSVAFLPVSTTTPPGAQTVIVEGPTEQRLPLTITRGSFPVIKVNVAKGKVDTTPEDDARIAREMEEFKAIGASPLPGRQWDGVFRAPVPGIVTCVHGTTRLFNGKTQRIHKGVDLRAATGTRVFAAAAGTVRLAKDVFFGGNLVYLDHGSRLFSTYAHLSRLDVKPGQKVQAGELLGLSGATGRVSAPHLHWGISLAGVDVDPFVFRSWTARLMGAEATATKPARKGKRRR